MPAFVTTEKNFIRSIGLDWNQETSFYYDFFFSRVKTLKKIGNNWFEFGVVLHSDAIKTAITIVEIGQ